jgi:hypothetical protein
MKLGKSIEYAPIPCPTCGIMLDGGSQIDVEGPVTEEIPGVGDGGVCIYCLGWWEVVQPQLARYVTVQNLIDSIKEAHPDEHRQMIPKLLTAYVAAAELHAAMVREGRLKVERVKK